MRAERNGALVDITVLVLGSAVGDLEVADEGW